MFTHSDRRQSPLATLRWAKSGPPLWGRLRKPLGQSLWERRATGTGYKPALRGPLLAEKLPEAMTMPLPHQDRL